MLELGRWFTYPEMQNKSYTSKSCPRNPRRNGCVSYHPPFRVSHEIYDPYAARISHHTKVHISETRLYDMLITEMGDPQV